jgi:hypothetical protein
MQASSHTEDVEIQQTAPLPPIKESSVQATAKALITVDSNPADAEVWVNGQFKGTTPLQMDGIKPGNYQLTVKKQGFTDFTDRINLRSGQNKNLIAELSSLAGGIQITTNPPSATIILDGNVLKDSRTPAKLDNIPVGVHKLEIKKDGYASVNSEVEIKRGEVFSKNFDMIQLQGTLTIQVRPWGSIFINDVLKKESADTKYEVLLPAKEHIVTVSHPTLGIWKNSIKVEADTETDVIINFNRKVKVNIAAFDEDGLPLNADILIDNKSTGKSTPAEIKVPVGIRKLALSLEGFDTSVSEKEIFVDKSVKNEHTIILKKTN